MDTTTAVISIVIALFTLVLAIFGASWLNQRMVERLFDQIKSQLEQNEKRMEARFTDLENRIIALEKRMDDRFTSLETRVDRIERQLETIFKPVLPK